MRFFKRNIFIAIVLFCSTCNFVFAQTDNKLPVEKILSLAGSQYQSYINEFPDTSLHLYSINTDSSVLAVTHKEWTSGFFPGCLWYLYKFTNDQKWKEDAEKWTNSLEPAKWLTNTHDLGFVLFTSFGNGYLLTRDSSYKNVLLQAARSLSTRFNPTVGSIKSWDGGSWHYPVIVDNLMNLELLFWAAQTFHDTSFFHIAVTHVNNDLKYRFRKDGSTYHVLDFDPSTGKLLAKKTAQGYSDSSCWARGQAWAIYGITTIYRYTHNKEYLQYAEKAANYFIKQINKIPDHIPYWDFNAPDIPNAERDVSAAVIAASALLELSHYDDQSKKYYYNTAVQILKSLCSEKYLAEPGTNHHFLLMHGVVNKHGGTGINVPLIYADYYFLQALWRYQHYQTK
jgi:unsaturated chondroitin disaccharide hydrolase